MGVFNNWPYTDVHQLNLDFILDTMKDVKGKTDQIDSAVETATTAAENAAESAENAEAAKEAAETASQNVTQINNQVLQNSSDIATQTARIDELITGSSVDPNAELLDIRVGANGITYDTAGNAVRGQYNEIISYLNNLTNEIPLWKSYFLHSTSITNTGAYINNPARASSLIPLSINAPFKIVSNNANVKFMLFNTLNNESLTSYLSEYYSAGLTNFKLICRTVDDTDFTSEHLSSIKLYSTISGKENFVNTMALLKSGTQNFPAYSDTNWNIVRYGLVTDSNNIHFGMLERGHSMYRVTAKPLHYNNDVIIWVGRFSNTITEIVTYDNTVITLTEGQFYTIPAGTYFICYFHSDNQNAYNEIPTNVYLIEKNSIPNVANAHLMTNIGVQRCDAAFIVEDKIFMISREQEQIYNVLQGKNLLVQNQPLDHSAGHANNCNYDPKTGNVYVSDWYEKIIHVYAVDYNNNSLSYTKDIIMPDNNMGSIEYYVLNEEQQILYLGWSADNTHLIYGLYIKTETGYYLSWERAASKPIILQGFTLQNNYLYYVENTSDYKTININRVNMATGLTEYNSAVLSGTILSDETEAIMPVDNEIFLLVSKNGYTYLITFIK